VVSLPRNQRYLQPLPLAAGVVAVGQSRRLLHARSMSANRTNAAILNALSMAALPPAYPSCIR
jgi:hypothetical protein